MVHRKNEIIFSFNSALFFISDIINWMLSDRGMRVGQSSYISYNSKYSKLPLAMWLLPQITTDANCKDGKTIFFLRYYF